MQAIFDKFQITEVIHSYTIHLDIERIDVCRDLFIEDGKLELRIGKAKGKEEIEALLSKIVEFTRGKRHFITNTLVDLHDGGAYAQSYLLVVDAIESTKTIMTGVYHDTFVQEDGVWKIHTRKLVVDLSF
jgi:hypothetical protein